LLRQETNGLATYRFESLTAEGLVHAVFTRIGGVSRGPFASLNVGHSVGDDDRAVAENHARIYAHLAVDANQVITARQVHGNHVALTEPGDAGQVLANTDGLATKEPGVALLLRFADCQPIVLYDPVHEAMSLIHAGWRGLAQGIAFRAVEKMRDAFESDPSELMAGLGPAIGPCCYTVGHDVAAAMGYALPDWRQVMAPVGEDAWRLDLSAANAQQLRATGIHTIEQANLCTACHHDEFFSHRAEQGLTGRFAVMTRLPGEASLEAKEAPASRKPELVPEKPKTEDSPAESLLPPGFPSFRETAGEG
jgi:YfiH family protein